MGPFVWYKIGDNPLRWRMRSMGQFDGAVNWCYFNHKWKGTVLYGVTSSDAYESSREKACEWVEKFIRSWTVLPSTEAQPACEPPLTVWAHLKNDPI